MSVGGIDQGTLWDPKAGMIVRMDTGGVVEVLAVETVKFMQHSSRSYSKDGLRTTVNARWIWGRKAMEYGYTLGAWRRMAKEILPADWTPALEPEKPMTVFVTRPDLLALAHSIGALRAVVPESGHAQWQDVAEKLKAIFPLTR